jgi:hypothetical protein
MLLHNGDGQIDWSRLAEQAGRFKVSAHVAAQLQTLEFLLKMSLPEDVFQQLDRIPRWRLEATEHANNTRQLNVFRKFLQLWFRHYRVSGNAGFLRKLWAFPNYLKKTWGLSSLAELPAMGLKKARDWAS